MDELFQSFRNIREETSRHIFEKGRDVMQDGRTVVASGHALSTLFNKSSATSASMSCFGFFSCIKICQEISEVGMLINETAVKLMQVAHELATLVVFEEKMEKMETQQKSTAFNYQPNRENYFFKTIIKSITSARNLINLGVVVLKESTTNLEIVVNNTPCSFPSHKELSILLRSLHSGCSTSRAGSSVLEEIVRIQSPNVQAEELNLTVSINCPKVVYNVDRNKIERKQSKKAQFERKNVTTKLNKPDRRSIKSISLQKKSKSLENRPIWR